MDSMRNVIYQEVNGKYKIPYVIKYVDFLTKKIVG